MEEVKAGGEVESVKAELEQMKAALRKQEEEQLGATLRARRKEKQLREQLRKQQAAAAAQ